MQAAELKAVRCAIPELARWSSSAERQVLRYKAASTGVEIVRVDPRGTSQTCPACGSEARKRLSDRVHRCECGCTLDRDVAAAKVVHVGAFGFMPGTGSGALSERAAA